MPWKIKATNPPHLSPRWIFISYATAVVFVVFAVLHLVRIDELIPVIAKTLGETGAPWYMAVSVIIEVFALPYLLRLHISNGLRLVSGLFVVLAPLLWTSFTIWAHGNEASTGQFSSYIGTPSSWWLIALNVVGLAISYIVLWMTRFDVVFKALSKKP